MDDENNDKENSATYNNVPDGQELVYIVSSQESETEFVPQQQDRELIYKTSDPVPFHLTLFFAFQQALIPISSTLTISLLVSEVVCAATNEEFKARLLSSTLFMNGITTLCMVTLGIRLPVFQGATESYVVPLLAMADIDKDRCNASSIMVINGVANQTGISDSSQEEIILAAVQKLQGSLIAAGIVHFAIGATGLVGFLLRFVGPITIVPAILLTGIYMMKAATKFAQVNWAISLSTACISLTLSLYLSKVNMPVPVWTKKRSFHIIRYPLHKVFSILIALTIGWIICLILTVSGAFNMDDNHKDFYSRTDARSYVIDQAKWFNFPYPGQFGPIGFSSSAFVGFIIATMMSILDSIGDYYACASICRVPPPPSHGVNRGIAVEGLCSALSGAVGCGHATTTNGGTIGAIGLTKVASRYVFVACAIIYLVFGIIGKISAVFITIPHPVLGGIMIVMFGVFNGLVLSNLKVVDLSSTRNLTIIGTSLLVGLMIPHWVEHYDSTIKTGNKEADDIIMMLLANPNLTGGLLACILDNTVPGTKEERGITAWKNVGGITDKNIILSEGIDVYNPIFFQRYKMAKILKYLPFMPDPVQHEAFTRAGGII